MRRLVGIAALVAATGATVVAGATGVGAGATTVPPTSAPPTTVTAAVTTAQVAPTTTAPTTTAGPTLPARPAARVASPIPDEKIRPTSLPVRRIVITLTAVILTLALGGFVYGKIRSRPPAAREAPDAGPRMPLTPLTALAPPEPAALAPPAPHLPPRSSPGPLPPPTAPPGAPPGGDTSLLRPPSR